MRSSFQLALKTSVSVPETLNPVKEAIAVRSSLSSRILQTAVQQGLTASKELHPHVTTSRFYILISILGLCTSTAISRGAIEERQLSLSMQDLLFRFLLIPNHGRPRAAFYSSTERISITSSGLRDLLSLWLFMTLGSWGRADHLNHGSICGSKRLSHRHVCSSILSHTSLFPHQLDFGPG
jgi:hypothetical protein